jgi:hypothetical protein
MLSPDKLRPAPSAPPGLGDQLELPEVKGGELVPACARRTVKPQSWSTETNEDALPARARAGSSQRNRQALNSSDEITGELKDSRYQRRKQRAELRQLRQRALEALLAPRIATLESAGLTPAQIISVLKLGAEERPARRHEQSEARRAPSIVPALPAPSSSRSIASPALEEVIRRRGWATPGEVIEEPR